MKWFVQAKKFTILFIKQVTLDQKIADNEIGFTKKDFMVPKTVSCVSYGFGFTRTVQFKALYIDIALIDVATHHDNRSLSNQVERSPSVCELFYILVYHPIRDICWETFRRIDYFTLRWRIYMIARTYLPRFTLVKWLMSMQYVITLPVKSKLKQNLWHSFLKIALIYL